MSSNQIFLNAQVVTMDENMPDATAFWVKEDRFQAVGTEEDVRAQAPPDTETVDLKGKTVLPGLIETHNHLSFYSLTLMITDCSPITNDSIDDVKEKLKAAAATTGPDDWVTGWGFDDTLTGGGRHLNRADLDDVVPDNNVFISHASGHLGYANSKALELAGVTRDTPQPDGGEIHKDENGEPTGLLLEPAAMVLVGEYMPKPGPEIFKFTIPEAAARYNRAGITSIHDAAVGMMGQGMGTYRAYRELEAEGKLNLRVYLTTIYDMYDKLLEIGLGRGFGSDFLKIGAVKMFQDGSIQGFTAALTGDYHTKPGHTGEFIMPQKEFDELFAKYHSEGLQIAVHANGDRAIESVITATERAQEKYPQPELRHMIIHCQMATDDHIQRMKKIGSIPSYFPNHVYYWGDRHESLFIGPERAARIDPLGSSVKAGLRFTLHADTPVTPIDPLHSIHCAVNRVTREGKVLGPDERITPYEALKTFTSDAAYCSFEEDRKGSISEGKLADFVVLSGNPLTIDPMTIKDIEVVETVVGGRTVYTSDN